jgi:hypothetical protein
MDSISIFAVDVGSPRTFAWVSDAGLSGKDGDTLAAEIARAFASGRRVAVGFECPLFIPVPLEWADIGKPRLCEGNRSWSAGTGATVTIYGLHEIAWILAKLRKITGATTAVFFSPETWLEFHEPCLLLWEAFVTGADKGRDHADDAERACQAFRQLLQERAWHEARQVKVAPGALSLNLAALAAEWAGWPVTASAAWANCW